jgi:hypothetical protein
MIKSEKPAELKEMVDQIISNINTYSNQDICNMLEAVDKSLILVAGDTKKFKKEFSSTLDAKYIDQLIDITLTKSHLLKLKNAASKRNTNT